MAARWKVRQFGAVRVEGPGLGGTRGAAFETQRAAKTLALLSVVRQGRMRREDLADALWPDDFYDATRLRLRKELSRLRNALGPAADALVTEGDVVGLDRGLVETDLDVLRRAVATPDDEARLAAAEEASEGDFLPGWEDPWAVAERRVAEGLKGRVRVALGERRLEQGRAEEALRAVREVIRLDPCHEPARFVAIRAHALLGSLANAVGEFQQMKRILKERQSRVPSPSAEALLAQVQAGVLTGEDPAGPPPLPPLALPMDRFFGRDAERATVLRTLAPDGPTRLVTLVGPGGIGKSRLAHEAALALRSAYEGQVAIVSLAEAASPEAAAATLLAHLGWQGGAKTDPVAVVTGSLPPGPCLLVLDGLEHLLPEAATLVKRLLEACPSLRVLATSRASLRLAGERIVPLGPMGEAAGDMLIDLARASRPALADDPKACETLRELARRLDGIPLALRLAAPRLRVYRPEDLLDRLADRFRLLQGDAPDLPERHRSLRAALDASFEGLGEREQRALVRMSPYLGGWTLAQLERALPDDDGMETMEALVDASFVSVDDAGATVRFGMLATVREYLAAATEADEAEAAFVRAMAEELLERLPGPLTPRSIERLEALDAEADNLHAATEIALRRDPAVAESLLSRLWLYDTSRGRHADFARLCGEFARAHPDRALGPAAEYGYGIALAGLADEPSAIEHLRAAERGFEAAADGVEAAFMEAMRHLYERRLARRSLEETLSVFPALRERVAPNGAALARVFFAEGDLLFYAKRIDEASASSARAAALFREAGDSVGEVSAAQSRALFDLERNAPEEAARGLERVRGTLERLRDPFRIAFGHELSGRIAACQGRFDDALAWFQASRAAWMRIGNPFQAADQDNSAARALVALGRFEEARKAARSAYVGWRSCGDTGGMAVALHTLADLRRSMGDEARAAIAFATARELMARHRLEFVRTEDEIVARLRASLPRAEPTADDAERLFD